MKSRSKLTWLFIIPIILMYFCTFSTDSFAKSSSISGSSSGSKSSPASSSNSYKSSAPSSNSYKSSGDSRPTTTKGSDTPVPSKISISGTQDKSSNPGYKSTAVSQDTSATTPVDRHTSGGYKSSTGQTASGERLNDKSSTGKSSFSANVNDADKKKTAAAAYDAAKYTPKVTTNAVTDKKSMDSGYTIYSDRSKYGYNQPIRSQYDYVTYRERFYHDRSYNPPIWVIHSNNTEYGRWDKFALWYMFDNIHDAQMAAFFHNHASDPGVQAWYKEATRLAEENGELKEKLRAYNTEVAKLNGTPINDKYIPQGVDPSVVLAKSIVTKDLPENTSTGFGWWFWFKVIFACIICVALVMWGIKKFR